MPELPEVQALAVFLADRAVGRAFDRVDVIAFPALKTVDPPLSELVGRPITGASRRGKFLDVEADDLHLVTHLARAGWLRWHDAVPAGLPKARKGPLAVRVRLDDGSGWDLTEAGTQKRLAVYLVRNPSDIPGIARLGIDPLDPAFTVSALADLLRDRRVRIKGLLKDQAVLAGVGNAYSDEALHAAKLSPFALAASLDEEEVAKLHEAIGAVLNDAVDRSSGQEAAALKGEKREGLRVHGRTGLPCPVCGDTVREVSFADSSFQYCPTCQTGGRVLADRRLSRLLK